MDVFSGMPWHTLSLKGAAALGVYMGYGGLQDVFLLSIFTLGRYRGTILELLARYISQALLLQLGVTVLVAYQVIQVTRAFLGISHQPSGWNGPTMPLLIPCRTTHSRFFPKKHSFANSYLMIGFPVGWEGVAGGMISTGSQKKGWYQADAGDYLERGNGHLGLRGKLDVYLTSQNINPSDYPYAYLVTAAKFLGYQFNPVSFWYLYSAEKDLTAMVLEVNNTFGERHMYFVTADGAPNELENVTAGLEAFDGDGTGKGGVPRANLKLQQKVIPKDFHVSPFNSRKGAYSLIAHDPFSPFLEGSGKINNTITLNSSKEHAKMVARVFSEGDPIDPTTISTWQKVKFLASWWWIGFVTFPRIVKEAGILFFQRKLHVWYRPEPRKQSMARKADETETGLEEFFRKYLRHLVQQCPAPMTIRYVPSGIADASIETMTNVAGSGTSGDDQTMEFKVLTPLFYTRFVYYAHDLEALFCELNDNCTIWVSRPDLLPKLLFKKPSPPLDMQNVFEYGQSKLIQRLRQRPERIEQPMTSAQTPTKPATHLKQDIRDFRPSAMDGFIMSTEEPQARRLYRCLVLKRFIADRLALGDEGLLWLELLVLKACLAWMVVR
ncbi:dihydroxyacetone kinase [Apiospora arundinis]|uniref:DNA-binding WRKY domain-containing protein n=1 Tax=Apiospora arundinis TaxID=335852 RepID=A0ABR2JBK6_9PEZI